LCKNFAEHERTVGIALIETAAGIADAEAIMAVEGASVVEREASHAALQTTTVARGVNKPSRPSPSRYPRNRFHSRAISRSPARFTSSVSRRD
jgi:hypothetical protein